MIATRRARIYKFGTFEADSATGELRRKGLRVRLPSQSFQVLLLLINRAGELVTRDEICRELWPEGTFVDYDHGVNSAINRLREALGDKAGSPRFLETLARRGYRFIAPVEHVDAEAASATRRGAQTAELVDAAPAPHPGLIMETAEVALNVGLLDRVLARPDDLPRAPHQLVRAFFLVLQAMYICFYIGALANLPEVADLISAVGAGTLLYYVILISAAVLIPVRTFLFSAAAFRAPRIGAQFLTLWPFLLVFDLAWSLSPFLLLHHINFGLALACVPFLIYSPFAQRSLVLMGAGRRLQTDH